MNHLQLRISKSVIQLASRIPLKIQEKFIKTALDSVLHSKHNLEDVENFSKTIGFEMEDVLDLIGFYISVINCFMQSDEKLFWENLILVGCNETFIKNFPLKHKTHWLNCISYKSQTNTRTLSNFKWRIDISFASGIRKEVPPTVIIKMELKTGEKYIIEIDIKTFHNLRFNIALALQQSISLEKAGLLRNRVI